VRGYKNFANKLWNITRFVLENTTDMDPNAELRDEDRRHLEEARTLVMLASANIDKFRLDLAADSIYHFVWDRFAAEILEESKVLLKDEATKASRQRMLYEILTISLKLLHPFMPFVTEAIWQKLPQKDAKLLMVAKWPK
jgi:valyl-tRNA synthetase